MSTDWTNVEHRVPASARIVVVLAPFGEKLWERRFAFFDGLNWFYLSSDARMRDVRFWCDLPMHLPSRLY